MHKCNIALGGFLAALPLALVLLITTSQRDHAAAQVTCTGSHNSATRTGIQFDVNAGTCVIQDTLGVASNPGSITIQAEPDRPFTTLPLIEVLRGGANNGLSFADDDDLRFCSLNGVNFPFVNCEAFTVPDGPYPVIAESLVDGTIYRLEADITVSNGGKDFTINSAVGSTVGTVTAPTFTKSFSPATIGSGQISTLTLTIDNSASTDPAWVLSVTDTLPTGLLVAATPNPSTTCADGTVTTTSNSITLEQTGSPVRFGASVTGGGTCTVSVDVTSSTPNVYTNISGNLTSQSHGDSGTASAQLTVLPQQTFTKVFSPDKIKVNEVTRLTFTIDNSANAVPVTGFAFSDTFPGAIMVAATPNNSTTCAAGMIDAIPGAGMISFSGGEVPANSICTISLDVTSGTPGNHANATSVLTSSIGTIMPATAILIVESLFDEEEVRRQTLATVKNFLHRRNDLLLASGPDQQRWMDRLTGVVAGPDGLPFGFTADGNLNEGVMSFAISLNQLGLAAANKRRSADGNSGAGPLASVPTEMRALPLDIWAEGHYSHFDDDTGGGDRDGHQGVVHLGIDYVLSDRLLIGAHVSYDWARDTSATLGTDVEGDGWMAGPYVMARLSEFVFFDGRAAIGRSDNDVSPFNTSPNPLLHGITDNFDTTRWLFEGRLTGQWQHGALSFSPSAKVAYVEDRQHGFVNSVGVFIPSQTVSLGQLAFGPTISYQHVRKNGTVIAPHGTLHGLWNFDQADQLIVGSVVAGPDAFRARAEGGLTFDHYSGINLRITGNFDGIGSDDFEAYGGEIKFSVPLN